MRSLLLPSLAGVFVRALFLLAAFSVPAAAAPYPEKPIRLVVPFPAGGGADVLARTIMPKVAQALDVAIVIDNRPGAGATWARSSSRARPRATRCSTARTARKPSTHLREPALRPAEGSPARLADDIIAAMLIVNLQVPANSVAELVRYAKANPGKVNFASAGNGTTSHLAGEMFRSAAGIDIVHVPYRGGALAATDLVGGQVQMMIDVMPNAYPLAQGGKVRALAVSTAARFPAAPGLPTIAEAAPGLEITHGRRCAMGTPPAVERLNHAIRQALEDRELKEALLAKGAVAAPDTPEAFARFIATESEKWSRLVKQSGAKVD
jgi:tripartite-type tricarboxylate transporter receptor subunit TctC